MKIDLRAFCIFACILISLNCNSTTEKSSTDPDAPEESSGPKVGDEAPTFIATDMKGATVDLRSLRGKVVILYFWAISCGPCRAEQPELVDIFLRHKRDDFEMLGIIIESESDVREYLSKHEDIIVPDDESAVQTFLSDNQITYRQIFDLDKRLAHLYSVRGVPSTFIIDDAGITRAKALRGEQLAAEAARLLGVPSPAIHYVKADEYSMKGERRKAIEEAQKALEIDPMHRRSRMLLALQLTCPKTKDLRRAAEEYQKVIDMYPEDHLAHAHLACVYVRMKEFEKADREKAKALELLDDREIAYLSCGYYHNLGVAYDEVGEYRRAIKQYRASVDVAEEFGETFYRMYDQYNLAHAYFRLREWKDAVREYEKLLAMPKPNLREASQQQWLCDRLQKARKELEKAKRKTE